jgi:putative peptidoglycan lipid II flippase
VVDRVLNPRPRSGAPIRSPAELAVALHLGRPGRSPAPAAQADQTATHTFAAPRPPAASDRGWRPSGATRGAQIGVVFVLVLGLALLGWQIVRAVGSGSSGQDTPAASPMRTIPIADVIDFDPPPGDNNENPGQAPLAVDGKPDTAWRTNRYRTPNFNKTKSGVGLVLDLGHSQVVRQVKLILPVPGESLQIRAAGAGVTTAPLDLDSYLVVAPADNVGIQDTLRFPFATNTRFLLVWITKLPRDGGGYRGGISEVTVSG